MTETRHSRRQAPRQAPGSARARGPEQQRLPLVGGVPPASPPDTPGTGSPGDSPDDWRLDERTRTIGLAGVAAARARLARPSAA